MGYGPNNLRKRFNSKDEPLANKAMGDISLTHRNIKGKQKARKIASIASHSHIQKITSLDGETKFHCIYCRKIFRSRSQQYYHLDCGSASDKKYKCTQCEKCFASRSHLNYHQDTHHSTQKYSCKHCSKTFVNRSVLQKHEKLHVITCSRCEQCGKTFRTKASLTAHVAAQHLHNLAFQCSQCDKKYAVKSTLQQHMLKHKAKQHVCNECDKRFQRNSTLKLHLLKHSKTERHVCTTCLCSFSDAGALQRHSKMHDFGGMKFRCKLCDTSTARKDNMLRHVRNMHHGEAFEQCIEIETRSESAKHEKQHLSSKPFDVALSIGCATDVAAEVVVPVASENTFNEPLPKTVANSSVIKCIGNVEPIKVPISSETAETLESNSPNFITLQTVKTLCFDDNDGRKQRTVKEKYNPIEMYRKILTDIEDEPVTATPSQQSQVNINQTMEQRAVNYTVDETEKPSQQRAPNGASSVSNFSEMHWRKNFKFTYEYQEC